MLLPTHSSDEIGRTQHIAVVPPLATIIAIRPRLYHSGLRATPGTTHAPTEPISACLAHADKSLAQSNKSRHVIKATNE